jgi:hypothetical protein
VHVFEGGERPALLNRSAAVCVLLLPAGTLVALLVHQATALVSSWGWGSHLQPLSTETP